MSYLNTWSNCPSFLSLPLTGQELRHIGLEHRLAGCFPSYSAQQLTSHLGECTFTAWDSMSLLSFSQTFSMGFISGDCAGHSV